MDQALIGHATEIPPGELDISTLTAAQRSTVIECLRAIAEHARIVMLRLVIYDAANEYILSTPRDQLDEPQATDRYSRIYREKIDAHPAARFVFRSHQTTQG